MNKAVFLDRDGALNYDFGYVYRPEDLQILPGVPEALRMLAATGYMLVVVTNQSGVAQKFYTEQELIAFNNHLSERIRHMGGPRLTKFRYCPHMQRDGCDCRKPKPGMLISAAEEYDINLSASYMIGDKPSDVSAGNSAGATSFLVNKNTDGLLQAAKQILNAQ